MCEAVPRPEAAAEARSTGSAMGGVWLASSRKSLAAAVGVAEALGKSRQSRDKCEPWGARGSR